MDDRAYKSIGKRLLNNQILGIILILSYCFVYGITAQIVLSGLQLLFFLCSFMFALSIFYVREPTIQKAKVQKSILFNQVCGTSLVLAYVLVFGISAVSLLNGFQLIFFMSSYTFAMSIFYIRDPERIQKEENTSISISHSPFVEKNPCFINSQDLSWLVRKLNAALSTVIGFCELMLRREYSENEKEYMLRNIYDEACAMSSAINKVASINPDEVTSPKEIHQKADLQNQK